MSSSSLYIQKLLDRDLLQYIIVPNSQGVMCYMLTDISISKYYFALWRFFKYLFFFLRFYLREREREDRSRRRGRGRSRLPTEQGASSLQGSMRLHPRTLWSWLELKADANRLSLPGAPILPLWSYNYFQLL